MIGLHSTSTDLVRKGSAEQIVGHRNRALELYTRALEMMAEAWKCHQLASPGAYFPEVIGRHGAQRIQDGAEPSTLKGIRKEVDADTWGYLINAVGLKDLMDATELKKLREQITTDPPELSIETIIATFGNLRANQQTIFRRGVVEVFRKLSPDFKNNDAYRLKTRVIFERGFHSYRYSGKNSLGTMVEFAEDQVRDLDRIFHILDGKAPRDSQGDATAAIRSTVYRTDVRVVETDYFTFKIYNKGTLHAFFKRPDLVTLANKLVAAHYGEVLADATPSRGRAA